MGSGQSTQNGPVLLQRYTVTCDSNGEAKFQFLSHTNRPGAPGRYRIAASVNVNRVRIHGVMVDRNITRNTFNMTMPTGNSRIFNYRARGNTPYCKGFTGTLIGIPNRPVGISFWYLVEKLFSMGGVRAGGS